MTQKIKPPVRGTAVIYLRAATPNQIEQDQAIEAQRRACQEQAKRHSVDVVAEFVDRGASGNDRGRRALKRLLAFVVRRHINDVIVGDHTRLSRQLADYLTIKQTIERTGAVIVAVDDPSGGPTLHQTLGTEAA